MPAHRRLKEMQTHTEVCNIRTRIDEADIGAKKSITDMGSYVGDFIDAGSGYFVDSRKSAGRLDKLREHGADGRLGQFE